MPVGGRRQPGRLTRTAGPEGRTRLPAASGRPDAATGRHPAVPGPRNELTVPVRSGSARRSPLRPVPSRRVRPRGAAYKTARPVGAAGPGRTWPLGSPPPPHPRQPGRQRPPLPGRAAGSLITELSGRGGGHRLGLSPPGPGGGVPGPGGPRGGPGRREPALPLARHGLFFLG